MARAHVTAFHTPSRTTPLQLIAAASLAVCLVAGLGAPTRGAHDSLGASPAAAADVTPDVARDLDGDAHPDADPNGVSWGKKMKVKHPPKKRGRGW